MFQEVLKERLEQPKGVCANGKGPRNPFYLNNLLCAPGLRSEVESVIPSSPGVTRHTPALGPSVRVLAPPPGPWRDTAGTHSVRPWLWFPSVDATQSSRITPVSAEQSCLESTGRSLRSLGWRGAVITCEVFNTVPASEKRQQIPFHLPTFKNWEQKKKKI